MERAQALIQAAIAEAKTKGWPEDFAVVDWGGTGSQDEALCQAAISAVMK